MDNYTSLFVFGDSSPYNPIDNGNSGIFLMYGFPIPQVWLSTKGVSMNNDEIIQEMLIKHHIVLEDEAYIALGLARADERENCIKDLEEFNSEMDKWNDAYGGNDIDILKVKATIYKCIVKLKGESHDNK